MPKSKQARARDFTEKARKEIYERDKGCIFCRQGYHITPQVGGIFETMHYIPKSQNGLGIARNGAIGCKYHHTLLDNGNLGLREEMLEIFREYLMEHYPDWNEKELTYSKWDFLKV